MQFLVNVYIYYRHVWQCGLLPVPESVVGHRRSYPARTFQLTAVIFLFATGQTIPAIGLLIWAVILVGTVDNLLNPMLISKKIKISPFLILFSVLGGISLLGPIGILIGPLAISLLYTLISIYRNEFKQNAIL